MINLTHLTFERVRWPGFPALFERSGMRVLRLVFWSVQLNTWCAITPIPVPSSGYVEIDGAYFANWLQQIQPPAPSFSPPTDFDADPDSGF